MSRAPEAAVEVLREVWAAEEADAAGLDEVCGTQKPCRNMKHVSFDGLAEPGTDIRSAWREKLEREGKLSTSAGTIRDLVLGSDTAR